MRGFLACLMAILALSQPAQGQGAFGRSLNARNQTAAFVYSSQEALNAERRQANNALSSQRLRIAERDERIVQMERELRDAGGNSRALQAQIEQLTAQSAAEKDEFSRQLAEQDAEFQRERQRLLEVA